ncbi:MAG: 3-phosphoshikimate 1-carboxyvinyltransferase [Planctomycetes bacterium]|nr:3-phosphoshikimate 1-carboxyvinyltransferase [Planctomycetota bacterium]
MKSRALTPITQPFDVRLSLPGSKSFANRALVCAALAGRPCSLSNLSPGDDTALMLNVLADLGWSVRGRGANVELKPPARPKATAREGRASIFTGAAGTATRFACALLCVTPGRFILDGNKRMRERPMGDLIAALRQLGAKITERGKPGCVPLEIEGASLRGGTCLLSGEVSSQFLSALLLVAPMVSMGVTIEVRGELVSKPYVDITLNVMRAFGLPDSCIKREGYRRFVVKPGTYGCERYECPPDATAASYFWGAAAVSGSTCVIDGLTRQDIQGDVRFVDVLERMGCEVLEFPNGLGVRGLSPQGTVPAVREITNAHRRSIARRGQSPNAGTIPLRAIEADMSAMPDCAQTLALVCAFAQGTSRLTGLSTLRVKETDRIAALCKELSKLGVTTRSGADWLEIDGRGDIYVAPTRRPPLNKTYEDHRMAMSFAIAGLITPLKIEHPEVVTKSFPGFWEYWDKITSQRSTRNKSTPPGP